MIEVLILGSGTSHGVPMIGCHCAVCTSKDPKNSRTRASILVRFNGKIVLVDTSVDFRNQMLRFPVPRIDAILFTHSHADHLHGLDDVRVFSDRQGHIDCYASDETIRTIRKAFDYIFTTPDFGGGIPRLVLHEIDGPFNLFGQDITPIKVHHGPWKVLGFRFNGLAYLTDVSAIPDDSLERLRGLDILILDALREEPHPTHFSLKESLAVVEQLHPRRTILTHISHRLDHEATSKRLPGGVELAYDGLAVQSE